MATSTSAGTSIEVSALGPADAGLLRQLCPLLVEYYTAFPILILSGLCVLPGALWFFKCLLKVQYRNIKEKGKEGADEGNHLTLSIAMIASGSIIVPLALMFLQAASNVLFMLTVVPDNFYNVQYDSVDERVTFYFFWGTGCLFVGGLTLMCMCAFFLCFRIMKTGLNAWFRRFTVSFGILDAIFVILIVTTTCLASVTGVGSEISRSTAAWTRYLLCIQIVIACALLCIHSAATSLALSRVFTSIQTYAWLSTIGLTGYLLLYVASGYGRYTQFFYYMSNSNIIVWFAWSMSIATIAAIMFGNLYARSAYNLIARLVRKILKKEQPSLEDDL